MSSERVGRMIETARAAVQMGWTRRAETGGAPRRSESGSAIVEMALVLPLMLFIMTGIATFSMALYQKLLLTDAVSSAGRVFAAEKGQSDPCADTWTALTKSSPGLASNSIAMTITYTPNGGTSTTYGKTCTALGGTTGMSSG